MQDQKLYVAVRADLAPGLATAQAVHAAFLFAEQYPHLVGPWMRDSQFLVIVAVPDETTLVALASRCLAEDLNVSTWHEPDRDDEATALAIAPTDAARRVCANLPLHGRTLTGTIV